MRLHQASNRRPTSFKFAFAALLAISFCLAYPTATAQAKKPAKYGTIKVQTTPAGLPIEVDGKPEGQTTSDWRAWDRDPGVHTIVIILPSGQRWTREIILEGGRIKCVALNYKPGQVAVTSPCPFPVNLSAPSSVNDGEVITYTSDVSYSGKSALNYIWQVSPSSAKVLSGSGTPTVTVDSTGLAGQRITATLSVDDGSGEPSCRQTVHASTFIPALPPRESPAREFDVCCNCSFDDQKARLDNLAVELQNDQSSTTYVFAYGGRTSRVGQADRLGARAREYLVNDRGIAPARIIVLNGGYREDDCVELWMVPSGATPPLPRPTVQAGDVRRPRETTTRKPRD